MSKRISPKTLFALAILIVIGWMVYQAMQAVLILITAAILATGLHQGASRLAKRFPGSRKVWLLAIVFAVLGVFVLVGSLAGPGLVSGFSDLQKSLMDAWKQLSSSEMVKGLVGNGDDARELSDVASGRLVDFGTALSNIVGALFSFVSGALLVFVLALFLVWQPELYETGLLSLFPKNVRPRLAEVMRKMGDALWHWLTGQGLAMLIVGVLTGVGLWLVGMKFALLLGIIAGLFQLIPYVGPFLSAVPGIVLALAQSPKEALFAASVYFGVQILESNLITPAVLSSKASLPPVLTLISTVALGLVFGPLGFIIATPLTLVALVVYRELYDEMILGEGEEG